MPALCKLWGAARRSGALRDLLHATEQVGTAVPSRSGSSPLSATSREGWTQALGDLGPRPHFCLPREHRPWSRPQPRVPEPSTVFVPPSPVFKMAFVIAPTCWGCREHQVKKAPSGCRGRCLLPQRCSGTVVMASLLLAWVPAANLLCHPPMMEETFATVMVTVGHVGRGLPAPLASDTLSLCGRRERV